MREAGDVDLGKILDIKVDVIPQFNPSKYIPPVRVTDEEWQQVPEVIASAVMDTISPDVPINAMIPYTYLLSGVLPHFLVAYFMLIQNASPRLAYSTVFGRAMHLIEAYREFLLQQVSDLNAGFIAVDDNDPELPRSDSCPSAGGRVDPGEEEASVPDSTGQTSPTSPQAGNSGQEQPTDEGQDQPRKKKKKKESIWSHIHGWEAGNGNCNQQ